MRKRSLCLLVGTLMLLCGCHKKTAVHPVLPAPPSSPAKSAPEFPPITAPPPPSLPSPTPPPAASPTPTAFFSDAERDFSAGNYLEAAQSYQKYLDLSSLDMNRDRALFRLAMSYALSSTSSLAFQLAQTHFENLIARFPASPYSAEAKFVVGLMQEALRLRADSKEKDEKIKRLANELDQLKKIDMERRPPRP
jgi:TolA-binding protein